VVRTWLALTGVVVALGSVPSGASAATCDDYSNQAEAQRAMDTRDADGDGIYCESLPCPCLKPGDSGGGGGGGSSPPATKPKASCVRPAGTLRLVFSKTKYRHIRQHVMIALGKGWPRVMVLNRKGADDRRDRLLEDIPTRPGFDRDEYPAAIGRGRPNDDKRGLVRGINPIGWMADVAYVPSKENRSHGSALGAKLRGFCDGTRFEYAFA
jgi:hypothetical protein